jgi:CspA family cold shock protein
MEQALTSDTRNNVAFRPEWKREPDHLRGTELMPTGRVKFFNPDRGYGFITPDGGESDVFVHISAVEAAGMDTLVAGQLLAYDIGTARDGRSKAINLRLLNPDGHHGARD